MAKYVIKNGKILLNGYDLSGEHNSVELTVSREERDVTTFGAVGMKRLAGMQSFSVSGSGFFEAGAGTGVIADRAHIDTVIAPNLGTSAAEITIMPQGTSVGSPGFMSQMNTFEYAPGGSVGDVMGFTFAGKGEGVPLVQGTVLKSGLIAATGTTTGFNLGHSTSHIGYATLHVTSTSGPGDRTLNVTIQSDNSSGFASPTTRITFTGITTALGSEWKSTTVSSSTDVWWRAYYITSGVNPGYTAYVTFGLSKL